MSSEKNKGGRPAIEIIDTRSQTPPNTIDLKIVEALCRIGATHDEIAAEIGISPRTLENIRARNPEFRDVMDRGHLRSKLSVRRRLVLRSEESDSCLIFLAKNYLGMSDKVSNEVTGKDGKPMEIKVADTSLVEEFLRQIEINAVNQLKAPVPEPEEVLAEQIAEKVVKVIEASIEPEKDNEPEKDKE